MFQNKFEIKIFENGGDIILGVRLWPTMLKKRAPRLPDVTRTGLIWNKPD